MVHAINPNPPLTPIKGLNGLSTRTISLRNIDQQADLFTGSSLSVCRITKYLINNGYHAIVYDMGGPMFAQAVTSLQSREIYMFWEVAVLDIFCRHHTCLDLEHLPHSYGNVSKNMTAVIKAMTITPRSLKHLCRLAIRSTFRQSKVRFLNALDYWQSKSHPITAMHYLNEHGRTESLFFVYFSLVLTSRSIEWHLGGRSPRIPFLLCIPNNQWIEFSDGLSQIIIWHCLAHQLWQLEQ